MHKIQVECLSMHYAASNQERGDEAKLKEFYFKILATVELLFWCFENICIHTTYILHTIDDIPYLHSKFKHTDNFKEINCHIVFKILPNFYYGEIPAKIIFTNACHLTV